MVETTHAFVKLKQIKAAVSAGGIKFDLGPVTKFDLVNLSPQVTISAKKRD